MAALSSIALAGPSGASESDGVWTPLLSPDALADIVAAGPVQLLDIRSAKQADKGTLPDATWVPFADWRDAAAPTDRVPGEEELERFLGDHGITPDAPVVVFHNSGNAVQMGRAAIIYWLLKTAGFEDIAILDGGYKAWDGAGQATADAHSVYPPQEIDLTYRFDWWADPMTVFGVASRQEDGYILDARFEKQVQKAAETGDALMSVPAASYISVGFILSFMSSDRMAPEFHDDYRAELEGRGIALGEDLVLSVCQTGELSALSWFYASEVVGIDRVLYYPDAIRGWEADGGLLFGLDAEL